MTIGTPIAFSDALRSRTVRSALPTSLSSAELSMLSGATRERALMSARVTNAEFLSRFDDQVQSFLDGETDPATMRLRMKEYLASIGYQPDAADAGSIKDLSTDARLNLVLTTNVQQAQGYGWFIQGQDPTALDEWPGQELLRIESRKEERDWRVRWEHALAAAGDPAASAAFLASGRFVARKDSPVWQALGDGAGGHDLDALGTPYPPYAFQSGMGVEDLDRDQCIELGLIDRDTRVAPQTRGFDADLETSPAVRNQALRDALTSELGPDYAFDGDVLRRLNN